jgi:hypothetical protein
MIIKNYYSTNVHYNVGATNYQASSWMEVKGYLDFNDVKTIKSLLETIKPNKVERCDKVWFSKGTVTREKMKLVSDEMRIKRVRKISEADKFVLDDSLFSTNIDLNSPVYCITVPNNIFSSTIDKLEYIKKYTCNETIVYSSSSFDKAKKVLNELKSVSIDFNNAKIETFYEVEGLYHTRGWGQHRSISTNEKLYELIQVVNSVEKDNSKGILLTEFFREADSDNACLDLDTYETLTSMVSSNDKENALMGLEVLSNCLIPEGNEPLISLVFKSYYQRHGLNKSNFTVSINSFIKRYKHVHNISNDSFRYLIPKLMNLNSSEEIKSVIYKMFIDEVNKQYFQNCDIKVTELKLNK